MNHKPLALLLVIAISTTTYAQDPQPKTSADWIKAAFESTNDADTFAEYDRVVKLCDQGLANDLNAQAREYLTTLSAWAYNRRGKELSQQAGEADDAAAAQKLEARAMADFQESIRRDADKWQAIHNRGVSYAVLGDYDKAIADFDRTLQLNARYPNAWFNRGEIRFEQGEFEKAAGDYSQAITLKPDDAGAFSARGHAYYQLKRYQNAISDFSRAAQLDPQDAAARTDRGDVYANLGQWREAASDYREAVKLNDQLGRAYMGAAWVMATCPDEQFRNAELALQSAQKAIALNGENDWRYLDTLAAAQASAGNFEQAQTTIKKAIARSPESQSESLAARLNHYAEGKPYRDAARASQR